MNEAHRRQARILRMNRPDTSGDLSRLLHWFFIVLLALVMAALVQPAAAADKFKKFNLQDLNGNKVSLEDVQGDKATLVAFFFPTCTYCNKAFPETVKVYEKYKDQGLAMVWINLVEEEEELIPDWLASHQYEVPVLVGASMQYLARRYDIEVTPEHIIINPEREILYRQRGYEAGNETELEARVKQALNL